jgi:hypothetical protein
VARRCGSGRISLVSFGGRPSFGAGVARMRAGEAMPSDSGASFGGDGSPSNNCLERAVTRPCGMRLRAAAQARR